MNQITLDATWKQNNKVNNIETTFTNNHFYANYILLNKVRRNKIHIISIYPSYQLVIIPYH